LMFGRFFASGDEKNRNTPPYRIGGCPHSAGNPGLLSPGLVVCLVVDG